MKFDAKYRGIGVYYTLDHKYSIEKCFGAGAYFIYRHEVGKKKHMIQRDEVGLRGFGAVSFGWLRDAKEFIEKKFYSDENKA